MTGERGVWIELTLPPVGSVLAIDVPRVRDDQKARLSRHDSRTRLVACLQTFATDSRCACFMPLNSTPQRSGRDPVRSLGAWLTLANRRPESPGACDVVGAASGGTTLNSASIRGELCWTPACFPSRRVSAIRGIFRKPNRTRRFHDQPSSIAQRSGNRVAAWAYGLNRDQYAHVLSTFKNTSYPKAPELCPTRFDELKSIGLDAFCKKHDPYWDIPLNENLPQPVIDLPGLTEDGEEERFEFGETAGKRKRKGRAGK